MELNNQDHPDTCSPTLPLKPRTHGKHFPMVSGCQDLVPQVEKRFQDGELDMTTIKPLLGTVKFHDVNEVMNVRHLVEWEGQALKDKLVQMPGLLDHTVFEDTDNLMSLMSVKSKTFYYHVVRAQCINSSPMCEHLA